MSDPGPVHARWLKCPHCHESLINLKADEKRREFYQEFFRAMRRVGMKGGFTSQGVPPMATDFEFVCMILHEIAQQFPYLPGQVFKKIEPKLKTLVSGELSNVEHNFARLERRLLTIENLLKKLEKVIS